MGVASMVIGIVSLLVALVPFCGLIAILPALIGLGLGIADIVSKPKHYPNKGMAVAGVVLNPLAVLVSVGYIVLGLLLSPSAGDAFDTSFQQQMMQNLKILQQQQQQQQQPGTKQPAAVPPSGHPPQKGKPGLHPMEPVPPDASADAPPSQPPQKGLPPPAGSPSPAPTEPEAPSSGIDTPPSPPSVTPPPTAPPPPSPPPKPPGL
jgi:hypothetical protein